MKNKKTKIAIISVIALILVTIAVTYAYWLVTKTQTGENEITAGCLDIAISGEKNDIELTNQFPMSDEDGMKLVPYEFTVTNNCNTSVDYQVALEATGTESSAIKTSALKVALNDTVTLLSSNSEVDTTIDGAYESRLIGFSRLAASGNEGSSDTHTLRIWIDENAPISEMSKTFKSKISVTIGQGIESIYEEGTLAYDILSNYGGSGNTQEIDMNENDHRTGSVATYSFSTSYKYYYGTNYTFDTEKQKYILSGELTQASLTECRNGALNDGTEITCGKYTLISTDSTYSSTTLYEVTDFGDSGSSVTAIKMSYTNLFDVISESDEATINKTQDDLGDSYYFRGNITNNYVQLGSWNETVSDGIRGCYGQDNITSCVGDQFESMEACQNSGEYNWCHDMTYANKDDDMYWRIVRINGDGTIRLVYDGVKASKNSEKHFTIIKQMLFNEAYQEAKNVGYTYDTSETDDTQIDSTIKSVLDSWYESHLKTTYGDYIADSIFCNDRSSRATDDGYVYYGAYDRLKTNKTPSLKCANKSDRYTVDDTTNGNGLLTNPIGLLTADEVSFAGGRYSSKNLNFYLYDGSSVIWTMTPYSFDFWGYMLVINEEGKLYHNQVNMYNGGYYVGSYITGARPVINLKADVEFTGNGTINNPYKIVTE